MPGPGGEPVQPFQQRVYTVQPQRRAKPAGEYMPPGNSGQDLAVLQGALFQPGIHKPFVTQGQRFVPGGRVSAKIHKAFTQAAVQLFQQFGTGRGRADPSY